MEEIRIEPRDGIAHVVLNRPEVKNAVTLAMWRELAEIFLRFAGDREVRGVVLEGVDAALTRFTVADLFLDKSVRPRLIAAFLMMLSVTFGFWGVATFVPTYVGSVAGKMGLDAPHYAAVAGLLGTGVAIFGFITLGFLADAIGRKPTAMLYYAMCLVLTPVVYRWTHSMGGLLAAVTALTLAS